MLSFLIAGKGMIVKPPPCPHCDSKKLYSKRIEFTKQITIILQSLLRKWRINYKRLRLKVLIDLAIRYPYSKSDHKKFVSCFVNELLRPLEIKWRVM